MPLMSSPYLRLMRLHQPTGIWLLLWPCWWSVALASEDWPSLYILLLFVLGAVLMRSAGCIINDMADRDFDAQVERTRTRPLASGELSLQQAGTLLAALLAASFIVALLLGKTVLLWSALALLPVAAYPWMKRVTWWPQLFLGFTFNWGALVGWAAVRGEVEWPAVALYVGGIFWTLGYDTIYAHQDKKDDARVGIKSTALRLGEKTKPAVRLFYLLAVLGWTAAAWLAGLYPVGYLLLLAAAFHLEWQVRATNIASPTSCRRVFMSNTALGWLVFAAFIVG